MCLVERDVDMEVYQFSSTIWCGGGEEVTLVANMVMATVVVPVSIMILLIAAMVM